jgi:DNA-binding NarL/FixJ family response regulator
MAPAEAGRATGAAAARVLLVEDEYLVALEVEAGLSEAGFAVIGTAESASRAVRLAKSESPDLIIMDVRLSGRHDGVGAAIEIYRTTGIRCIFASAYANAKLRERAAAAAPYGWLQKPYRVETLVKLIRKALGQVN